MTIQDFIKQGHKWIELKGVPVRDNYSKSIVFIHNHFFEGKELEFQNELIADLMKLCPTKEWDWRVYGGDTPDADMVDWIYTQTAEIVIGDESVMPAWCKNGQHVLFEGRLHVIECAPKKEYEHLHEVIIEDCETHHCHFENWDNLTPCTPDGRELLPEPPAEVHIDVEPTFFDEQSGKAEREPVSEITDGTEVWTTIELYPEYGKRGKVVRKFFADHGVWCLDIEFEDGTTACYAEEYVTTEKPWAVVGARCKHKYLNRDVALTIIAVGQYYGIKAESEDGKVKRCGLVRDFEPVSE